MLRFKTIVTISIYLSIFISSYVFFREPFEAYVSYVVFVFLFPFFFMRYGVPKYPVLLFVPLLVAGVTYCAVGLNSYQQFFKVFIGFFTSVLFYHYVIEAYNFDLKRLFRYYMYAAVIVSVIGIFQLVSFKVGFIYGYDFRWIFNKWGYIRGGLGLRLNSIFGEPAYFAAVVAPAFFVSLYNFTTPNPLYISRKWSVVVMVAYALTYSSLGIGGIFLAIVLLLLNLGFVKYAIIVVPLFLFLFKFSYENVPEFQDRYDGTVEVFGTGNYSSYQINGSSFVLYNNYHVATENFKRHPLLGTGLGSHPTAFDKYSLTNLEGAVEIDFNKMDANSMFLRLMSETGLYGLFVIFFLLFSSWVFKARTADRELWVMSNGIAIIIILFLARQGHYFLNGFPFFLWMYYYIGKANRGEIIMGKADVGDWTDASVGIEAPQAAIDEGPNFPKQT